MSRGKNRGKEIYDAAIALGGDYSLAGKHARVAFQNGESVTVPITPSDHRSVSNAISLMERVSGRRLPRQKTGRVRFKPGREQFIKTSPSRMSDRSAHLQELIDRFTGIESEMTDIANTNDYSRAKRLCELNRERDKIADVLDSHGYDVPVEFRLKAK